MLQYNERSFESVTRLKTYLNENIISQLPPLETLWRYIEELAIIQPHLATTSSARPVIEEVLIVSPLII